MPFTSCGGCLKDIFITEAEIIDRYVGNQLWAWGLNTNGQLGDNSTVAKSSPVQTVSGGTNWKQATLVVSAGAGIKTDGTLWLWGNDNLLGDNTTVRKSSPVQTVSGGTNWKKVAVGQNFVAALKTDGTLWLWGTNSGSLGDNTSASKSSPVQTVSGGNNWKDISAGGGMAAAIKMDGTLWVWGSNNVGQLGDNSNVNKSSPVQTVSGGTNWKQVSVGFSGTTGAIKTDGTLWVWGGGISGELGIGITSACRSSPVQTVSGGTNWKQISMGSDHTAALKTDGTLWTWGYNFYGQLGSNNRTTTNSPAQIFSGGTNWKQVSAGSNYTAGIKTDGTLWLWGWNAAGELARNDGVQSRSSPVQTISGGTNWKQVFAGDCNGIAVTFTEL